MAAIPGIYLFTITGALSVGIFSRIGANSKEAIIYLIKKLHALAAAMCLLLLKRKYLNSALF